jgi:hypothetical protein
MKILGGINSKFNGKLDEINSKFNEKKKTYIDIDNIRDQLTTF